MRLLDKSKTRSVQKMKVFFSSIFTVLLKILDLLLAADIFI